MRGVMRLYPESPIVPCDYDESSRRLSLFNFFLGRPYDVVSRKDTYSEHYMAKVYNTLLKNKRLIYACCYNTVTLLTIDQDGFVETSGLFDDADVPVVRYFNKFDSDLYFPKEEHYVIDILPTKSVFSFCYTEPGQVLYFPERKLVFTGTRYIEKEIGWAPQNLSPERLHQVYTSFMQGEKYNAWD